MYVRPEQVQIKLMLFIGQWYLWAGQNSVTLGNWGGRARSLKAQQLSNFAENVNKLEIIDYDRLHFKMIYLTDAAALPT